MKESHKSRPSGKRVARRNYIVMCAAGTFLMGVLLLLAILVINE